jgi:hypothetical protein
MYYLLLGSIIFYILESFQPITSLTELSSTFILTWKFNIADISVYVTENLFFFWCYGDHFCFKFREYPVQSSSVLNLFIQNLVTLIEW